MENLKKKKTKKKTKWTYLQRNRFTDRDNKLMVTKEDVVRLTRRQVLTCAQYYIHTTENQQDLLYSTWNSIQYFVITVKKIESEKE